MDLSLDFSRRFTLDKLEIRGQVVRLSSSWRAMLAGRAYPDHVAALLGELACVAVLVGTGLKHAGRATLQIQGGAHAKLVVVDCTHELGIRSMVSFDAESAETTFAQWVEGARLALTLSQFESGQMYQSIVPVSGLSVAECFEHYFDQSEQLPTHLWLAANIESAGALLLQKMPKADEKDADGWARVEQLAASVTADELTQLDAEHLLTRLFHQEDVRLFEPKGVFYDCKRDVEKVKAMLRSLGREELDATLDDVGEIVVRDDMCHEEYRFSREAIAALFTLPDDS
jgi:molecular chaperone Hsp33